MTDGALGAIEVIALAERTTLKVGNIDLLGDVEQK